MLASDEFGVGAVQGMLRADKRSEAMQCMMETLICQMQASIKSDKAKEAMDAHMDRLQQQVERGVEDMFRLAETTRTSEQPPSNICAQCFPPVQSSVSSVVCSFLRSGTAQLAVRCLKSVMGQYSIVL